MTDKTTQHIQPGILAMQKQQLSGQQQLLAQQLVNQCTGMVPRAVVIEMPTFDGGVKKLCVVDLPYMEQVQRTVNALSQVTEKLNELGETAAAQQAQVGHHDGGGEGGVVGSGNEKAETDQQENGADRPDVQH